MRNGTPLVDIDFHMRAEVPEDHFRQYLTDLVYFCIANKNPQCGFKPNVFSGDHLDTEDVWITALNELAKIQEVFSGDNPFYDVPPFPLSPLNPANYNVFPRHYVYVPFGYDGHRIVIPIPYDITIYGPLNKERRVVFASPFDYIGEYGDFLAYLQMQTFYYLLENFKGDEAELFKKWNKDIRPHEADIDTFCSPNFHNARCVTLQPEVDKNKGFLRYTQKLVEPKRKETSERFKNALKASIGMKKNKSSNKNRAI